MRLCSIPASSTTRPTGRQLDSPSTGARETTPGMPSTEITCLAGKVKPNHAASLCLAATNTEIGDALQRAMDNKCAGDNCKPLQRQDNAKAVACTKAQMAHESIGDDQCKHCFVVVASVIHRLFTVCTMLTLLCRAYPPSRTRGHEHADVKQWVEYGHRTVCTSQNKSLLINLPAVSSRTHLPASGTHSFAPLLWPNSQRLLDDATAKAVQTK